MEDLYRWTYREHDLKNYMAGANIAEGEILDGAIGAPLKVCSELKEEQVGKIHAIAALYRGEAYSSVKFTTHYDTISAIQVFNRINPLYEQLGEYYIGFATVDDWFLDPWTAFKFGVLKNQIHKSIHTTDRRPLYTNEVLFFNKNKE